MNDPRRVEQALGMMCQDSRENLLDKGVVERHICEAGIFANPDETHEPFYGPEHREYMSKQGLNMLQQPQQLAEALVSLGVHFKGRKNLRYTEIGVFYGGTFIFIATYLHRMFGLHEAVAVDLDVKHVVSKIASLDIPFTCEWLECNTQTREGVAKVLNTSRDADIVFIDGDHSFDGVRNDFNLALRMKPEAIMMHDIVDHYVPGVPALWRALQSEWSTLHTEGTYVECLEQFKRPSGRLVQGIGLVFNPSRAGWTLKQELKQTFNLSEDDFGSHESDLYVLDHPGIRRFLKERGQSFEQFIGAKDSPWGGKPALDIPFAAMNEHIAANHKYLLSK